MVKRTLYFGSPAYLKTKDGQLVITNGETGEIKSAPIEDIGVIVLDHKQITITQGLLCRLSENDVVLLNCDDSHHPISLTLPIYGNSLHTAKVNAQISVSVPLTKQLWQQTVKAKIYNQAMVLKKWGKPHMSLIKMADNVQSGDPKNLEARAAAYYWKNLLGKEFKREREGLPPNNLLNYGYAIVRAMVARALVSSGMIPAISLFHRNKYNPFCLADDIMEPFRPFVDDQVMQILTSGEEYQYLTKKIKFDLLNIPVIDILIDGKRSPMQVGLSRTTASLVACYEKTARKILYPEMNAN